MTRNADRWEPVTCDRCRFGVPAPNADEDAEVEVIVCHLDPPTMVPYDGKVMQLRPEMRPGLWCGRGVAE